MANNYCTVHNIWVGNFRFPRTVSQSCDEHAHQSKELANNDHNNILRAYGQVIEIEMKIVKKW